MDLTGPADRVAGTDSGAASQRAHARVAQVTSNNRLELPQLPAQRQAPRRAADAQPAAETPEASTGTAGADLAAGADLGVDQFAGRLAGVQHRIQQLAVDAGTRSVLQARLLSVCDALKARRPSVASCERRLRRLIADVERIESV